jgi:probable HAF family extracellular repeat protein
MDDFYALPREKAMRKSAFLSSIAGIAVCVGECHSASAAHYSIREIPQITHAVGVNRNGVVVGEGAAAGTFFVYVYSSGVSNELPADFSASDINDHGQIIGDQFFDQSDPLPAIVYVSGGQKVMPRQNFFLLAFGHAISKSGRFAAVQALETGGHLGGFFLVPLRWGPQDDSITSLGLLADQDEELDVIMGDAQGVNDEGVVVGNSGFRIFDAMGNAIGIGSHAVRWQGSELLDLGALPGGQNSDARGINDRDEIVGHSDTASGASHAFLLRRHKMLDLGTLGHDRKLNSDANRINDWGEIVGWSEVRLATHKSVVRRAFVYSEGRLRDLTRLIDRRSPLYGSVTLTSANAISSNGWIVADGLDDLTMQPHAYLLIPQGHRSKRVDQTGANDDDQD